MQQAVKAITGKAPAFFRPPFGSGSEEVRAKAKEEGLLYMTWSNGSKDWEMTVKKITVPSRLSQTFSSSFDPAAIF